MAVMGTCSMWVSAPKRARLACYVLAAVVTTVAIAWSKPGHWTKPPTITVIAEAGDPRSEAVREAVAFWNRTFAELGTPFRLGEVTWVADSIPDGDIRALGRQARYHPSPTMPASLERFSGDMLIVLSNATFISYTAYAGDRVVIAIKNGNIPPLSLPNVLRNVVAHELGHACGTQSQSRSAVADVRAPGALSARRVRVGVGENVSVVGGGAQPAAELYPRNWPISGSVDVAATISTVSSLASKMIRASPRSS